MIYHGIKGKEVSKSYKDGDEQWKSRRMSDSDCEVVEFVSRVSEEMKR